MSVDSGSVCIVVCSCAVGSQAQHTSCTLPCTGPGTRSRPSALHSRDSTFTFTSGVQWTYWDALNIHYSILSGSCHSLSTLVIVPTARGRGVVCAALHCYVERPLRNSRSCTFPTFCLRLRRAQRSYAAAGCPAAPRVPTGIISL